MKLTGSLIAAAVAMAFAMPATAQERISIGTGGTGGLFYVIGAGMAELITEHMPDTTARAEVTGASIENIRRTALGELELGFSSSSTLYEAASGTGAFDGDPHPVAALAYLYPAVMQVATTARTGITSFEDLAGRPVSLGPPGSNAAVLAQRLLESYGAFSPENAQFLSYAEGVNALVNGSVDAAVVLAGAPVAALIDLDAREDMVLLPVDAESVAGLLEEYPFYQLYEIPANTYGGVTDPTLVINDPAVLFVHADAPDEFVQAMTAALFDNLDTLGEIHPLARLILHETAPNTPIDLHAGAAAYFAGN
ncbi:TAXI family TRAP transporter solute-binding subunit [Roseinatronobacter alkalisoli]|uniref:TAXI family TRAP transporter solute-binding subunit n=1 Tax=Roseinatronobacter alkalisoli TaxID=3028235 RepID=A0ABT5T3T4_9RHOB|nr:TAXI family TRAP transporter solute-binding subunit [Roseinatronobacter sp. HJB301]MDD7969664.1 TAXI family TRAP transporter solute-binding subunit [Roseinatronobacter sp. HJB301]